MLWGTRQPLNRGGVSRVQQRIGLSNGDAVYGLSYTPHNAGSSQLFFSYRTESSDASAYTTE